MKNSFFTRFLQGGGLSIAKLITGLIKIKFIAILLGVEGVGLLSLAIQFQAVAVALVSMSLAVGIINLGRPRWVENEVEAAGSITGTAFVMVGINSVIFLCLFFFFHDYIVSLFFGSLDANVIFWPIVIAAIVTSFANSMGEGVLFLFDRFDLYVRVNIISSVVDAASFVLGAWFWGLQGALFAALVSSVVLIVTYAIISFRLNYTRALLGQITCSTKWLRPLYSYCMLMIVTTGFGLAALFIARSQIVVNLGAAPNGLLQVVTALAAYMLPFVMNGVWGHLHPYVAALGDCVESRKELRRVLIATVRLGVAGCVLIVLLAPVLVSLVYTKQFLGSLPYISIYFIGQMLFIFISILGAYLLSTGLKLPYFIGYLGYHVLLLIVVVVGAKNYGIWAYVGGHMIAALIMSILAGFYSVNCQQLTKTDIARMLVWVVPGALVCITKFAALQMEQFGHQFNNISFVTGAILIALAVGPYLIKLSKRNFVH